MRIGDLMASSGVGFGTSGARGLVSAMTDEVCYSYTLGFVRYLQTFDALAVVGLAGDYRASTPRIIRACAQALHDSGIKPRYFGQIPTPALAAYGQAAKIPSLMITGSHIPEDRNGIKFYLPHGEILKADEEMIRAQEIRLPPQRFDATGALCAPINPMPVLETVALECYVERFLEFFSAQCLAGLRIGIYEHSSVAREVMHRVFGGLGAEVVSLAPAKTFVPVDTEAIRPEDVELARTWCANGQFSALVSTDGDGDRPLLADEAGRWWRGDQVGVLCARALSIDNIVTPVSSSTAVERCGWFRSVRRTRIGSPYVITEMQNLYSQGVQPIMGYEANGGVLLGSSLLENGRALSALPTRDALLPMVALCAQANQRKVPLSTLLSELPARFTASDRIKNYPTDHSRALLDSLQHNHAAVSSLFGDCAGDAVTVDDTDGLRIQFAQDEIIHLRPSGNAPELRIYTEAADPQRAKQLNQAVQARLRAQST